MDLTITVEERGDCTLASVSGDIDAYTAPELRAALLGLVQDSRLHIVIDMSGVSFLDSTGLGVLIGTLNRQRKSGGSLGLAAISDRVFKIFRITSLDTVFDIHPDVDDALKAAAQAS